MKFVSFIIIFSSIICQLVGCGPSLSDLSSLIMQQPRVVSVEPAEGMIAPVNTKVVVTFSIPIDPTSINENSFAVINIESGTPDISDLASHISKGDAIGIKGEYVISDDWRRVTFEPAFPLGKGMTYYIIVTTQVKTISSVPLNQNPGEKATPFWSNFTVSDTQDEVGYEGGNNDSSNQSENGEDVNSGGPEGDDVDQDGNTTLQRPSTLVINEILYDSAQSDTDGNEFIELFGDPGGDISGYSIIFINGADGSPTEVINIPSGSIIPGDGIYLIADSRTNAPTQTNIAQADLLDNFDPQNGPDCVQLLDNHGALLDALGYGEPLPEETQNGLTCYEGHASLDAPAGMSISRTDAVDTDDNSVDFQVLDQPSPGIM